MYAECGVAKERKKGKVKKVNDESREQINLARTKKKSYLIGIIHFVTAVETKINCYYQQMILRI